MAEQDPNVVEDIAEHMQRYRDAAHAMQSGVAMKMNYDAKETTPKHLRVGVNVAMSDHGALVKLLVDKGVITEAEYFPAIADAMECERDLYQAWLQERIAPGQDNIRLG